MKNMYIQALAVNNYVTMSHSVEFGQQKIKHAAAWKQFCTQPIPVKQNHSFSSAGGYEYKPPSKTDYKEDFHVSLRYKIPLNATEVDKKYIYSAKELIHASKPFVLQGAQIASEIAEYDIVKEVLEKFESWQLRDLHYFPRLLSQIQEAVGDFCELAESHPDKGLTFHFYEDEPGFEALTVNTKQWQEVVLEQDKILMYAGLDGQYYSKGKLTALVHRVMANAITESVGRYACVMFAGFGRMKYDKGTYGRAQTRFGKGENYGMPHEVLSGMFIPEEQVTVI